MEITKGKWKICGLTQIGLHIYTEEHTIATGIDSEANAERIVKAVNSYDAMYEALKELEYCFMNMNSIDGARQRASIISANKALAEGK